MFLVFNRTSFSKYFIFLIVASGLNISSYGFLKDSKNPEIDNPGLINQAPVFGSSNYFYDVSESIALGSSAGSISATDADGDQLIYSIKSGNTNKALSINSATGAITVVKRLNHHTQSRYTLVVKATDPAGLYSEASVTIIVQAVTPIADFTNITWGTTVNQPYGTHEVHGEVVNEKLYIFGGYDVLKRPNYTPTKRSYVYDPIAKTWASIADLPHNPKGTDFGGITHEGLTTDGTDIYFAGGYKSNADGTGQAFGTKEVWRYNVASNNYTTLPGLPVDLAGGQLRYLKGKIYYIAGTNKLRHDTSVHYALNLDSLSLGWKVLAPVLNPVNHPGSAVFEGKIYLIGGSHHQDPNAIPQNTVEAYDPNTNAWTKVADIPVARDHISSSVVVMGNCIVVLGGMSINEVKSNLVSAYSPATNTWRNLTPLPVAKAAGVAAVMNGNLYYTGANFSNINYKGVPVVQADSIKVESFTLINADTDQPIKTLSNNDTLNLTTLPTANLNIRANTLPGVIGSVLFNLTGPQNSTVTESKAPYALFGDNGSGDYYAWNPPLGKYTLKGTPYSASGATGTSGSSKTIIFTVINNAAQRTTLLPQADAFVRNGSYANTNYGNDTSLSIKSTSSAGFSRSSYLKFSLPDVSGITSAKLRVYGSNTADGSVANISVYGIDNDSWAENIINWSNAPQPASAALNSAGISNLRYYEIDVTDFVKSQSLNDKLVSLLIKDPSNANKFVRFNSKENNVNPPQLVIEFQSMNNTQTSINNQITNSSFSTLRTKVYPNPVHTSFNIEFPRNSKGPYDLQIADIFGRIYKLGKVKPTQGVYNMGINVEKLSLKPGIHFLTIHSNTKQTQIIKLVVE